MSATIFAALLNSAVLGLGIAAIITLVLRMLPRRSLNAATRYAVWWLTLGIVVALPLLRLPLPSISLHRSRVQTLQIPPIVNASSTLRSPDDAQPVVAAKPETPPAPAPRNEPRPIFAVQNAPDMVPRIVVVLCGILSGVMLLRLFFSCLLLERTKARAHTVPPEQALRVSHWLALCCSRRKNIALKISTEISCPIAAGPLRTSILVPPSFFSDLSDAEIDQAGLHETAHLVRRDDCALLLQRIIEAVWCWHPAIRWITRQIDLEREIACDDFVVERLHEPRSYASCLTHLAELAMRRRPSLLAAGAIEEGSHLTLRVELLLDRTRHTGTRLLRARLAVIALLTTLLALSTARIPEVIAFAQPLPTPQAQAAARPLPTPTPAPAQVPPTPSDHSVVAEWIKTNAIPLKTVQAGNGFSDMQPLQKIIGNARIVSLGEATHGTREFFQLKHRMVEFLASQMGFTIFSIEANMPEAYRLNDYVLNGNGDPAALLKGMYFWTSDTQEVLAMIEWMRDFNKSGKGRIEFTGFDMQTPDVAGKIAGDFIAQHDRDYLPTIHKAPYAVGTAAYPSSGATGNFPVEDAAGKMVRFSANIKTQGVDQYAGLWWRADGMKDGAMRPLVFRNLGNGAPKGTTDWKRYDLNIAVPAETKNINFGVLLAGGGTAWFDGLEVSVDGTPYMQAQGFDLLYRGRHRPQGDFTLGTGYTATFESPLSSVAPGQSLQIRQTEHAEREVSRQPQEAVARWQEVFDHMQANRAKWLNEGVPATDVDWAIQNARVVLQSAQMKGGEITRDRAMADNVKWILDRNPQAKIVLWAHNGHVGTRGASDNKSMGAELRSMYGGQMVVFGFAFNEGSFQSIERGKGLRNFTVPASPAGSFDATLAATGIPILALDLKHAPATGPVADWLTQPHKARSIGSIYAEDAASQFFVDLVPQTTYDAILFVEKTSASIANAQVPSASLVRCADQVCREPKP